MPGPLASNIWPQVAATMVRAALDGSAAISQDEALRWLAELEGSAVHGKGLLLGTWAKIEDDCPMEFKAYPDQVELSLGGGSSGFELVVTEGGMERLLSTGNQALQALRAVAEEDAAPERTAE